MVHGKFLGSPHFAAPVLMKMCGTFLALMYLWIAVLVGVPRVPGEQQHLLFFDQLAHLLDGTRRAVPVIEADEVDLAAIDAAAFVHHVEVGSFRASDHAVSGSRSAIGVGT